MNVLSMRKRKKEVESKMVNWTAVIITIVICGTLVILSNNGKGDRK